MLAKQLFSIAANSGNATRGDAQVQAIRRWVVLTAHEWTLQWRHKDSGLAVLAVALLEIAAFDLSMNRIPRLLAQTGPGILWMGFLFSGTLTVTRAYAHETAEDVMTGLYLAALGQTTQLVAKLTVNFMWLLGSVWLTTWLWVRLFMAPTRFSWAVMDLILSLGVLGLVSVGLLIARVGLLLEGADPFLTVWLMVLDLPVTVAAMGATWALMHGGDVWPWVRGLAVFDLIFLTSTLIFSDYLREV